MIKLLIYLSIVLFVVLIARLSKVVELAQKLRGGNPEFPTDKDNRMNGNLFLIFIVGFLIFVYYGVTTWGKLTLSEVVSVHGVEIDWLMNVNMVLIFIPFVLTHIFLALFAFRYAGKKGNRASFFAHSNKLELIWTVIPAIVLTFVISYGLKAWNSITSAAPEDAIVVELYAKQFDWTARYAGKDNTLGDANYRLISGTNDLGVNMQDGKSGDDFLVKGEFHIPVGKPVSFKFRSRDVIHSAYMPHFRAQMNCVPGMVTQFHFVPTITTAEMRTKLGNEKFDYLLLCNKICGAAHYNMQMAIIVDTPEDYAKWVKEQKTLAEVMTPPAAKEDVAAPSTEIKDSSATSPAAADTTAAKAVAMVEEKK